MIAGYFDPLGRPYVKGDIYIPRLDVAGTVNFLVDTGAGGTLLHSRDGRDMGIPMAELANPVQRRGTAGTRIYYAEPAIILFPNDGILKRFDVQLYIAPPDAAPSYLPSLLGRDVLNRMRMEYDFPAGRLELAADV